MAARWLLRSVASVVVVAAWSRLSTSGALAAVTPGWECVPTTKGQPVVSGGVAIAGVFDGVHRAPAPTFVASGVDGKPTVEFSTVNVQIVDGTGDEFGERDWEPSPWV